MQEVYGDIDKKVGKERVTVGEYTVNFLFGLPSVDMDWNERSSPSRVFYRPDSPAKASSVDQDEAPQEQSKNRTPVPPPPRR